MRPDLISSPHFSSHPLQSDTIHPGTLHDSAPSGGGQSSSSAGFSTPSQSPSSNLDTVPFSFLKQVTSRRRAPPGPQRKVQPDHGPVWYCKNKPDSVQLCIYTLIAWLQANLGFSGFSLFCLGGLIFTTVPLRRGLVPLGFCAQLVADDGAHSLRDGLLAVHVAHGHQRT
jgi:hypothetical protein